MKLIDLHTHSTMSDGSMAPEEVVNHAKKNGLTAIALTDHDSVEGVERAILEGKSVGVEVVAGVEMSAQFKTETHILGYDIDTKDAGFLHAMEEVRRARLERNMMTAENLRKLGFDVTYEEAAKFAPSGVLGRAHYARLMVEKGYVQSVKEAFDKYLSSGKAGYCDFQRYSPEECIEIINNAGGKAFLAHLHLIRLDDKELEEYVIRLKNAGLSGIEGYYTEYDEKMHLKYLSLAKKHSLLISGGTDFHGEMKPQISIGTGYGNMQIPYSVLENMRKYRNLLAIEDKF